MTEPIIGKRIGETSEITVETILATTQEMKLSATSTAIVLAAILQAETEQKEES